MLFSCQYRLDMVTWKQVNNNVLAYYWPRQKHAPNEHLQLRFIVMMSIHYLHMSIIYKAQDVRKLFWIIFGLVIGQIIKLPFFHFCAPLLLLVANRYLEPLFVKIGPLNWLPKAYYGWTCQKKIFYNDYISFRFLIYKDQPVILLLKPYLKTRSKRQTVWAYQIA